MQLAWSPTFSRAFKRLVRQNPQLRPQIENTLQQLVQDPFYPSLRTHRLKGELSGKWSCSIDYSNRIVFKFVKNLSSSEDEILLLALGSHDEVY
jgi:addiction module RelE/StbE family toxin